jgi:UDP-glucuronate 4-epimerase
MAYFSFTRDILLGKTIKIFNNGKMKRDFTYIEDIIEGIVHLLNQIPTANPLWDYNNPDPATSYAPYRIYNIGNNKPVELMKLIELLEKHLGVQAIKEFLPMQPGDVMETYADIDDLSRDVGFAPKTSIEEGIAKFVEWYKDYYSDAHVIRI